MSSVIAQAVVASVALIAAPAVARAGYVIDPNKPPGLKSPEVAVGLSLGGTLASWVALREAGDNTALGTVGLLGAYFAPSLGHLYAGEPVTRGLLVRTVGAAAVVAGLGLAMGECGDDSACDSTAGQVFVVGGIIAFGLGTLDDIVRAPIVVQRQNARIHQVGLTPTLGPGGHTGLALGGRF